MKKSVYLLIGILVLAGFGILGYLVGEGFQQANINEHADTIEKTRTYVSASQQNNIEINS